MLSELNQQSQMKNEHYGTEERSKVIRMRCQFTSKAALRAKHHFMGASYFLFMFNSVMFVTSRKQAGTPMNNRVAL
jgi:hypothetical protein